MSIKEIVALLLLIESGGKHNERMGMTSRPEASRTPLLGPSHSAAGRSSHRRELGAEAAVSKVQFCMCA
jgi:hypothetical protein